MIWIIYKLGCSIESLINIYSNILECALSYGENCQYPCSVHCINKVCDRFNGTCLFGCAEGKNCDRGMCISFLYFYYCFVFMGIRFISIIHAQTLKTYISDAETPRNDKTTDVPGPTWWIIAFALSFVINIILITHTMIRLIKQW